MALPVHPGGPSPAHRVEAYVVGDADLRCVWIHDTYIDERRAVLWPEGYRAAFDPVRIYDPRGRVVWREDDLHTLSGGPVEVFIERIPRACRTGKLAWWLPNVGLPYEAGTESPQP